MCACPALRPPSPLPKPLNRTFQKLLRSRDSLGHPNPLVSLACPESWPPGGTRLDVRQLERPPLPASSDLLPPAPPLPSPSGKHEERQDEHGYISRCFTRKYT